MKRLTNLLSNLFIFLVWILILFSIFHKESISEPWRIPIFISLLLISVILFFKAKQLSKSSHVLIVVMILSVIFGEIYFGLYYTLPIYDKILHFFVPFILVFVSFDFLSPFEKSKRKRLFFSILLTFSLVIFWEIFEIAFDYFFDAPMIGVFIREPVSEEFYRTIEYMSPLTDTFYDVILGILGILFAYVIKRN